MSLTRKLLKELELNDAAIERIITAHTATVDAIRQERDAASAEAAQHAAALAELTELPAQLEAAQKASAALQADFDAYRAQVDAERHQHTRRTALTEALEKQGANPMAIPLLLDVISLPEEAWDGDSLVDAAAVLHPIQEKYGPLFARRTALPVTRVQPPIGAGGTLTHADVMRMSADDINRNWSAVRSALQNNR